MATIVEHLKAVVGGDITQYESSMQRVTQIARKTGQSMQKAGKIGLMIFGGLAVASLKYAIAFDKAVGEIETIIDTNVTDIQGIREEILALSEVMGVDATKLAKGYYQVISAGITDTKDAMVVMTQATELSIATMTEQEVVVDVITSALNAYGLAASEATRISDVLFTTVRMGKTRMGELAGTLGRIMPIAAQNKITFEELNAAIVALTLTGQRTDLAVTGLRALIVSIMKPTKESAKYAKELGLEWDRDTLMANDLSYMMNQLREVMKKTNVNIAELVPNVRAMPAVLTLAGMGADSFANAMKGAENASGATATALEKQRKKTWKQLQDMWTSIKNTLIDVGTTLMPVARDFTKWMGDFAKRAGTWVKENAALTAGIIKWGLALSGILLVGGKLISMGAGLATIFGTLIKTKVGLWAVQKALLAIKTTALSIPGKITMVVAAAYVGWKVGKVISKKYFEPMYDEISKHNDEVRNGWEEIYGMIEGSARATDKLAKAGYKLKEIGMFDPDAAKKNVDVNSQFYQDNVRVAAQMQKRIGLYDLWRKKGMEVAAVLRQMGKSQKEILQMTQTRTIAELNEILVTSRNLLDVDKQAAVMAEVRRKQAQEAILLIQELAIKRESLLKEATASYRAYYRELQTQLSQYENALESAKRKEQSIVDARRKFADETRTALLKMETARDDPTVRRKKYLAEAQRLEKAAAEQIKQGNIQTAEEYRRAARQIYESLAGEHLSAEREATEKVRRLRESLNQLQEHKEKTREKRKKEKKEKKGGGGKKDYRKEMKEIGAKEENLKKQIRTETARATAAEKASRDAVKNYRTAAEESAKQLRKSQADATVAVEAAKQNLDELKQKVEALKADAGALKIVLETETAEAAVARLSANLTALNTKLLNVQVKAQELMRGPENLQPGKGAAVTAPVTQNVTNTNNITTNVHGVDDPKELARKIVPEVERRLRRRQQK